MSIQTVGVENIDERAVLLSEYRCTQFRRLVVGDTDSKMGFALFVFKLSESETINGRLASKRREDTLTGIMTQVRPVADRDGMMLLSELNCIVIDGHIPIARKGAGERCAAALKLRYPDREGCAKVAPRFEGPATPKTRHPFVMFREPNGGHNVRCGRGLRELFVADSKAKIHKEQPWSVPTVTTTDVQRTAVGV